MRRLKAPTIPTILTLIRLLLIPVFVLVFYLPFRWANITAASLFALAAITDWLDGFLARKLHQTTIFGAFLDPVVDKLMVAVALVLIIAEPGFYYLALPAAVIIGREIAISALREWMAEIGSRASVAVGLVGKIKTTLQFIAIVTLLVVSDQTHHGFLFYVGSLLLYCAAALTLWSMMMYLKAAWPKLDIDR